MTKLRNISPNRTVTTRVFNMTYVFAPGQTVEVHDNHVEAIKADTAGYGDVIQEEVKK